jgi:hypothetical protein
MLKKRHLVALGVFSAALAGCGSTIDPIDATAGNAGASPTGGATAGGSAGSSGGSVQTGGSGGTGSGGNPTGGNAGAAGGDPPPGCVPGIQPSSQIARMKKRQYDAVMRDLLGVTTVSSAPAGLPSSFLVDDFEGAITDIAWNGYLDAAAAIAAEVMAGANKSRFIACDPARDGCLTQTIRTFGRKAFRRPLTDAEVTSFERLNTLTPAGTPEQVAEAILYTFLASPSFIMIPELAQELDASGAGIKLNAHEVAARLAFFLWNSVPDETLSLAADRGELATKDQIFAQASRMVGDRMKTGPVVAAFHRIYADIRVGSHWNSIEHDATKYPKYTAAMRAPMMAEIDAFFEDVAFQNGGFKDLFLSRVAYVNRDTAAIYKLNPADYGTELTRVELAGDERPGFLTRIGFLSSFSSFGSTSPLLRGAYISRNILGIRIEDPPEDAAETQIPDGVYTTYRQAMEALTADPKCASCHTSLINPPGFVLEHFDSLGEWQDLDPAGGAIDGSARVLFSDTNIKTISSPLELMTELGTGPEAKRRYATQWVTFATGRGANPNDTCTVDTLDLRLAQDGYTILNLLTDLTQADSFRLRTVQN